LNNVENPDDHLIFRVLTISIGWHLLLVVSYFIWYLFQHRHTAKHYTDHIPGPNHSTASALQLGAFGLPPRGPSEEVPLSFTQVTFPSFLIHVSSAAQRRVLELGNGILTFTQARHHPRFPPRALQTVEIPATKEPVVEDEQYL
jgi:hypothetical protein